MKKRVFIEAVVDLPDDLSDTFVPDLDVMVSHSRAEVPHKVHLDLTSLLRNMLSSLGGRPCKCCGEGDFKSPLPGIVGKVDKGRISKTSIITRCDECKLFDSDREAEQGLHIFIEQEDFFK